MDGHHYQICLSCGVAYEYDWEMMRRTNHLLALPLSVCAYRSHSPEPGASHARNTRGNCFPGR
jgi:hypothetical protein